jgi:hypothetical protein
MLLFDWQSTRGWSRLLLLLHREHIKDLRYHTIKRSLLLAENITCPIEPQTRFFELRDAGMQCHDRDKGTVVHVPQDLMRIARRRLYPVHRLLWTWFWHFEVSAMYGLNGRKERVLP